MVTNRTVVVLIVLASLNDPCSATGRIPTQPEAAGVSFESTQPGEVQVSVTVGGRGPYRFLLDTGSTHTAVHPDLAHVLSLRPVAKSSLTTSTGTAEILIVRLDAVRVGPVEADGLLASVLPREADVALGPGVSGILGQDFLRHFNYTLDYRRSMVFWSNVPDSLPVDRLALVRADGRFLVELPQAAGSPPLRFVPDSGADGILVFNPTAVSVSGQRTPGQAQSLVGTAATTTATLMALKVGRQTLRQQPAHVLNVEQPGVDRGDGLLPLHLFRRVHFNNAEGYMTVE
ncbi:MAG: retropepsin-like aspartic protease [Vicinamibacterales bacterium]